jgi:hypothetical protein
MKIVSKRPPGDDKARTWRIELPRLFTVTPCRLTSCGRSALARCTRLLTLMVAWSGSVPMANVTVRLRVPELVEVERM